MQQSEGDVALDKLSLQEESRRKALQEKWLLQKGLK
jgi:hypothetical protein